MPVQYIPHPIRAIATEVTGTRALDTIYQNALLRPLMVICNLGHRNRDDTQYCACFAQIGIASPPGQQVTASGYIADPGFGNFGRMYGTIVFMVPPGWFYRVADNSPGANVSAITDWWEVEL